MVEPLVAWIPLLPGLAAAWIAVRRLVGGLPDAGGERLTGRVSTGAALISLVLLLALDLTALVDGAPGGVLLGQWFAAGDYAFPIGFHLDGLSLSLATLTAWIGFLALRFSINYMHREVGFQRFFLGMNLFLGAMLLIELAGNALLAFVGWELAGISSWMLIGYALERPTAVENAERALLTNRIGDAGFLLAIFFCFPAFGGVGWDLVENPAMPTGPLLPGLAAAGFTVAALAKSAQVPFTPWITRALDGPTPSSALFYGAVMAHAGVYLTLRLEPLLLETPWLLTLIGGAGLLTSLYGWLCGLATSDVKGSLIFSTIAQLGLMFALCGLGLFTVAAWHLGLHAAWRAHQFLHAPALMAWAGSGARPAPRWLQRLGWLHTAAIQRFWLEPLGDALVAAPLRKLSADADALERRVINPLLGLPSQAGAISAPPGAAGQDVAFLMRSEGEVGEGQGLAGKLIQGAATGLHHIEKRLLLQGDGGGTETMRRLGSWLTRLDNLISQPRYLLFMILVTLAIIL